MISLGISNSGQLLEGIFRFKQFPTSLINPRILKIALRADICIPLSLADRGYPYFERDHGWKFSLFIYFQKVVTAPGNQI